MDKTEKAILDHSIKYKELYKKTPWWKFKQKREYYDMWQSGLKMLIRYYD